MNNITWTDSETGRTFWKVNGDTQEWEKYFFITWEELKLTGGAPMSGLPKGSINSVVSPPKGG